MSYDFRLSTGLFKYDNYKIYLYSDNYYEEFVSTLTSNIDGDYIYYNIIEEIDIDTWTLLSVKSAAEPNDGLSPFEELDFNGDGLTEESFEAQDWSSTTYFD